MTEWKAALKRSRYTSALYEVQRPHDKRLAEWLAETGLGSSRQGCDRAENIHLTQQYGKISWPLVNAD